MSIYAALGAPEIWRYRKGRLEAYRLGERGEYHGTETSRAFPWLRVIEISRFLAMWNSKSDLEIKNEFRAWVREKFGRD